MKTLIELVKEQNELEQRLANEISSHKNKIKELNKAIKTNQELRNMIGVGLDQQKILEAEKVIRVDGSAGDVRHGSYSDQNRANVRINAINSAISDLVNGGNKLKTEYVGVKNYSGFGDQREDHKYGYGPRHGSIVFRISLVDQKKELTEKEIEAAIYYLTHIKLIQDAKQAA